MRPLLLVLALATPLLGGCDLALAGLFMPPILPGVGFPLTGQVLDSETRLPIGGATVTSGLGSTISDASGHFSLYGGLGSNEVSVCRAGYTSYTEGDVEPNAIGELRFELTPLYREASSLPTRFVELTGTVAGLPAGAPAQVFFGNQTAAVNNGVYDLTFKGGVPGNIFSSVLAWGSVSGAYNPSAAAVAPFNYTDFHYKVANWRMGDTIPASKQTVPLPPDGALTATMATTSVTYKNLAAPFSSVQTVILLDFGVLGSVPVAVATGSNQRIPVPQVNNLKYDVIGTASDPSGTTTSTVQLTTNNPALATFQLLDAPKILSPEQGATGAGQRPTFSWTTTAKDQVTYEVSLFEEGQDTGAKWIGHTSADQIQYPAFGQGDINGGALRSDRKYHWSLREVDALGATQLPTSKDASPVHIQPYRVRQREAAVTGYGFSL